MRSAAILAPIPLLLLLLPACGGKPAQSTAQVSREPISVRGWIADIDDGSREGMYRTVETEAAKRTQSFQATNVWVDNAPYVSGGVSEAGAFVLLDVPPGKTAISFSAPGIPSANVIIENVPGNADVLIPGLILRKNGVSIADTKALQVRIAGNVGKPTATGAMAHVAGVAVPITRVPVNALLDRRDYPTPPGIGVPLATVR